MNPSLDGQLFSSQKPTKYIFEFALELNMILMLLSQAIAYKMCIVFNKCKIEHSGA